MSRTIKEQRELQVRKSNVLIQKSKYSLTAQQYDIVDYIISKVQPTADLNQIFEFSINDFCKVCGLNPRDGKYTAIKKHLQAIDRFEIMIPINGEEVRLRWFNVFRMNKNSGIVKLSFAEDIKPFVYELKKNFTQYTLANSLALSGKYAKYIYSFCKSWEAAGNKRIAIAEFIVYDCPCHYEEFKDIKRWVLEPSIKEINKKTDIQVSYRAEKSGGSRKYTHLYFTIRRAGQDMPGRMANRDLALMTEQELKDLMAKYP